MKRERVAIEEFPRIALTIECPLPECGAVVGDPCRGYLHAVRVFYALERLPRPAERNV